MEHFAARNHAPRTQPPKAPEAARARPTHEEIAALAYSYWEGRGREHGSAWEDWLRAERTLERRADAGRR